MIAAEHVGFTTASLNVEGDMSRLKSKTKKTYNNLVSAIRCCFEHGYKDHPQHHNPATGLKTFRLRKKEHRPPDPFNIQEAEAIIARSHREFGEAHGNYEEFRFFSALRQSEQMALTIQDCDLINGKIRITKAVVLRRHKDYTKTGEDREIELCGRALAVLKRQLALRESYARAGRINHYFVFFQDSGAPLADLSYAYNRWLYVTEQAGVRYREPYQARASYISWSLMIGKNIIKLAQEDGHSIETMLRKYAAWTKGATEADISVIKQAMETSPIPPVVAPSGTQLAPLSASSVPVAGGWGRLSWRKRKQINTKDWRSGRDSNPRPPA
jgi:integrase